MGKLYQIAWLGRSSFRASSGPFGFFLLIFSLILVLLVPYSSGASALPAELDVGITAAHRRCGNADSAPNAGLYRSLLRGPVYDCWRSGFCSDPESQRTCPPACSGWKISLTMPCCWSTRLPSVRSQAWLGESTGGEVSLSKDGRLAYGPFTATLPLGSRALTETRLTLSIGRGESLQGGCTWVYGG